LAVAPGARHNIPGLRDGSASPGVPKYTRGSILGDGTTTLNNLSLDYDSAGSAPNMAVMKLNLAFLTNKMSAGSQEVLRTINISVEIESGNLKTCIALSEMSDGIWQRTSSNLQNIFFTGTDPLTNGFVGIGTDMPLRPLHVNSATDQGMAVISGNADGDETYSALYLMGPNGPDLFANSWVLGHKKKHLTPSLRDSLVIGKWSGGSMSAPLRILTTGKTLLEELDVNGEVNVNSDINVSNNLNVSRDITAQTVSTSSDFSLKKNLRDLDGYEMVSLLEGVRFQWKNNNSEDIGFIAQSVQKVAPALVTESVNGKLALKYGNITALLVEAFKTLDFKLKAVEKENLDLRKENLRSESLLKNLEKRIEALETASSQN